MKFSYKHSLIFSGKICFYFTLDGYFQYKFIKYCRNPALDEESWPEYNKENPVYRIFNAEGDEKHVKEELGKGPMASACAFWNTYLPRLKTWTGKSYLQYIYKGRITPTQRKNLFHLILFNLTALKKSIFQSKFYYINFYYLLRI